MHIKSDLVTLADLGAFDAVVHGCNCFCTMGSGVAKQLRSKWPEIYSVDEKTKKGDQDKLGSFSIANVRGQAGEFEVVNAYTQFSYGSEKRHCDYEAIEKVFKSINQRYAGKIVGYPAIGAGLAGGDWEIIEKIIKEQLSDTYGVLVQYQKAKTELEVVAQVALVRSKDEKWLKVVTTGGREFQDSEKTGEVMGVLQKVASESGVKLAVASGGAKGSDTLVQEWCQENGVYFKKIEAEWEKYGKAAGPMRNNKLVALNPAIVVGFHYNLEKGRGTQHMLKVSQKAKIPTVVVTSPRDVVVQREIDR